jgi:CheY-like chemotaxis protein
MGSPLILLAEDDPATREFLAEELTADGYNILQAHNGRHALALLVSCEPDLVLADVNGQTLGLLDAIRTGAGFGGRVDPNTPVIVLTKVRTSSREYASSITPATTWWRSRSAIRSCADGSARSCAAHTTSRTDGYCASGH